MVRRVEHDSDHQRRQLCAERRQVPHPDGQGQCDGRPTRKDFRVEIQYKDPATGLTTMYKTSISFSRVVNGSGITDLLVMTPNGNIFKNGQTDSLTATAQLWRGSNVDSTNVTYQWYVMDSSVNTDQGGGIGWRKLANASGQFSGVTTSTLTIYAGQVDSSAVFKCVAKDTDSASATYNQTFSDTASFVDLSDPIQVIIESTAAIVSKMVKAPRSSLPAYTRRVKRSIRPAKAHIPGQNTIRMARRWHHSPKQVRP